MSHLVTREVFSHVWLAFGVLRGHAHSIFFAIPSLIRGELARRLCAHALTKLLPHSQGVSSACGRLPCRCQCSLNRCLAYAYLAFQADLLDRYTDQATTATSPVPENPDIGFGSVVFSWEEDSAVDGPSAPSGAYQLRIEEAISFEVGRINIIVGPTGCGKTSMLMALLGEMHHAPLSSQSWVNLPRDGGVAYAAQVPWIQNATIKVGLR